MSELSGWARYPRHKSELVSPRSGDEVVQLQSKLPLHIARGNGRAYGDAAIGVVSTVDCRKLDRMIDFDPITGLLTVEAGVLLSDVLAQFLPRGFFPTAIPGTQFVTIGGMIASDVHGKNHHRVGGFGSALHALTLVLPSGERLTCTNNENSALFAATIGGMGLTGTIIEACFRLQPVETGWVRQQTIVTRTLDDALSALAANDQATYSVAWVDCTARGKDLGRSLVYLGEHATRSDLARTAKKTDAFPVAPTTPLSIPVEFPGFVLNRYSVAAFNEVYFRNGSRHAAEERLMRWDHYFFPLDAVLNWNRVYGRRGFLQHQSVVPEHSARDVLGEMLDRVARRGSAPTLAVLKQLSAANGLLSFPLPGYSLALDFPFSSDILSFLDEIDRLVCKAGGRIYLAKDARQSPETFAQGYPALPKFRELRKTIGADRLLRSRLAERLAI